LGVSWRCEEEQSRRDRQGCHRYPRHLRPTLEKPERHNSSLGHFFPTLTGAMPLPCIEAVSEISGIVPKLKKIKTLIAFLGIVADFKNLRAESHRQHGFSE
jgi:hypothetical protein